MKLLIIRDENISFREAVENLENERLDGICVGSFHDSVDCAGNFSISAAHGLGCDAGSRIIFVRRGDDIIPVKVSDISGISTGGEVVIIHLRDGRELLGELTLKEYGAFLDPRTFKRISRQWIINVTAIQRLNCGMLGSGHIYLEPDIDIVVSREKYAQILKLLSV